MKNALLYGICASGADFHGGIAFSDDNRIDPTAVGQFHGAYGKLCIFRIFMKGCWLGNYMMLYRMKPVNANGVDWQTGILINLLVIAAKHNGGGISFGRYDVLNKNSMNK